MKTGQITRANGYIIAKQLMKEGDNFDVSMDISPDNRLIVFGYGPNIKLVSLNTELNFWFEDRKTLGKGTVISRLTNKKQNIPNNLRVVRDIKWNCCDQAKNLIGVAIGESALVYDVEDIQTSKTPEGFIKVFSTENDVMRQGDYPSKFVWYPNSKDLFLCPSSKSDEIVIRDLRTDKIAETINGHTYDDRNQQKIQDLKFNPIDPNMLATISKNSTIDIFDLRKPEKPMYRKQSVIQTYKSNLLDWQWNGNRLASAYGGLMKVWGFNGPELAQKISFQHKNAISDLKWLKKRAEYLLVSEMQENIIYGYRINKQRHDMEILVDPRHSGLKKFMTDRNEQMILGLTNFEDSKKHQNQMIAVFIDYKNSQSIWSQTKFTKANSMGLDNQLLFSVTRKDNRKNPQQSFALVYEQNESSARKINNEISDAEMQTLQERRRIQKQEKGAQKKYHKEIRAQRKQLQKQIQDRSLREKKSKGLDISPDFVKTSSESTSKIKKTKKSNSIDEKNSKHTNKTSKSLQKKGKNQAKSTKSFSQSSQQNQGIDPEADHWIMSYYEEVQYFDKHYKIEINEQVHEMKGENICKHNSKVAKSIGKDRCAQFWKYLYEISFPQTEQRYTLAYLYQDKVEVDILFKENKIIASCENKSQMSKKIAQYSIEKLIQNLVDENQLQTAVMACIMLRNKDPKLLKLQFIEPFLVSYKELLKSMGLIFISTNLSFIANLNQAVQSPTFNFEIQIGCAQCHRRLNDEKCNCLQVCIFCGESLKDRLVIGCKICGHMAHAREYSQWMEHQKCPIRGCQHQCFKG